MWNRINEQIGYVKGSVNQGVIFSEHGVILIDTGLDKQAARKIIRLLNELQVQPIAIVNTHAHADHFGGNQEILTHNGDVQVYAPIFEETTIRHPIWEPSYLYGGASPLVEMENKFLLAPPSPVHHVFEPGMLMIDGIELQVVPLYGHSYRQMGIGIEDVLFAADSFYGMEVLIKHPIPFHVDTRATLDSLESLRDLDYTVLIPGHGTAVSSIDERIETIEQNKLVYDRVNHLIVSNLQEPKTLDQLQAAVSNQLEILANNAGSYLLYRTAILAQLKYLVDTQQITQEIQENQWFWRKKA